MNIRHFIHAAVATAMTLLAASCANDDLLEGDSSPFLTGQEVAINFSYSVQGISSGDAGGTLDPQTRTVPDDLDLIDGTGLPIKNMFIIQFSGNSPSSTMVGAPRFLDAEDLVTSPLSVPLIQSSSSCYTLFVANIPEGRNYNWNMSTQSTFSDVVKRIRSIASENEAYVTVGSTKTLLASAVVDSPVEPTIPLAPSFTRSVAKLTLSLKLDNPDMVIKSVRLRNVSTGIVYADAALAKTGVDGSAVYPEGITTIDYDIITTGMPFYNETKSFSWYVPRNQRGVNTASSAAVYKTFYAPDNATYFEIVAVKTVASASVTSMFRVYPGANEVSDFNITANNHYTIGLTVKDIGDDADSRVETFGNVSYVDNGGPGSKSNSFIINPAPAGGGARYYDIPIDQVNRYWDGSAEGYGKTPTNVIGSDDTWTVSLVWSDLTGLFSQTYDPTGASGICLVDNNTLGSGQGKGPVQFFRLLVPAGMPEGNFTLGIKKGSGEYLWSWHFWVTGYNPDKFNKSVISGGVYTYPVPGGQVERYGDSATGTSYWSTTNGVYKNSVMMDRALGMVSENIKKQPVNSLRGILHYQFGRKDPFPAASVQQGSIVIRTPGSQITIKESMSMPNVFIPISASPYVWTSEASATTYLWCDPNSTTSSGDKSIYDPCPPGWCLPVNGTWNDFSRQADGVYINTQNTLRDLGYNYGLGFGSVSSNVNGLRYWPGTTLTAPVGGTIWYPAAGYRYGSSGSLGNVGSSGCYWSASPSSSPNGCYLGFNNGSVGPNSSNNRAGGFSVRCIAE